MQKITKQSENFAKWYQDVVAFADLAESSEVRGCGIIKPYGFKIWELIKQNLANRIEATGAQNVYFPIFIPLANLETEKEHVEGFAPELAVVTHGGGQELTEKLTVRPTSETGMYKAYAKWISSYRDLPLRLNQWNNVVRWEKRPRAFLRWSEFLWQEGHTVFETKEEAIDEMWQMLGIYEQVYKDLAIPVFKGKKSEKEKFAGADITTTVEVMAKDGKAIQGATSHHLGQNFSKVFDIKFAGKDGKEHFPYQNSWGFTWRSVGAVIMAHGDDFGLKLPPNVAPIQVVIVPVINNEKIAVLDSAKKLVKELTDLGLRVKLDDREDQTIGYKFNEWELKGVPLRITIGSNELKNGEFELFRRDKMSKEFAKADSIGDYVVKKLIEIQEDMYNEAKEFADSHVYTINNLEEIDNRKGFFRASWCESKDSENLLKEKYKMVSRVLPVEWEKLPPTNKKCFITGQEAKHDWLFAKSY